MELLRYCYGITVVFLCHCFESAVGLLWYFPFIAVGLLCNLCGGVAVMLLWNCLGFPGYCCGLAVVLLRHRGGTAVVLLLSCCGPVLYLCGMTFCCGIA